MEVTEAKRCAEMFLHDGLCGLLIANCFGCRRGRRIKDTFSILKDVRTQGYLIVNAIRTEQEGAGDVI